MEFFTHSPENVTSICILLVDTAKLLAQRIIPYTVHDMENLTFSTDNRADNPHIAARPSAYVRTDNQRIPCGTISGFRAEFCGCKTKITQSENVLPA